MVVREHRAEMYPQGSRRGSSLLFLFSVLGSCILSQAQTFPTDTFQLPPQADAGSSQRVQLPNTNLAQAVPDPHAPVASNCFAAGEGIREGAVGKVATFEVVARDMFGDEHRCDPERFVVKVIPLTASHDEDAVQCHAVQSSPACLACRQSTVCFTGTRDGACQYAYTPEVPGFFRVQVLTPSTTGQGLLDIQGSPFRAHVEDGGVFLPGMSALGYLGLFMGSVGGAVVLVTIFFAFAWKRWKRRQPPSEDDLEIARLERMAEELEVTRRGREERAQLLSRVRARRAREEGDEGDGGIDDSWMPTDSSDGDDDEKEEMLSEARDVGEANLGWFAHTVQGMQRGKAAWERLEASWDAEAARGGERGGGRGGALEMGFLESGGEAWKEQRRDSLDDFDGGYARPFGGFSGVTAFEIGGPDSEDEGDQRRAR